MNKQPKASFKQAEIFLPTSPATTVTLYWLETHRANVTAPLGIRYLHLRNRQKGRPDFVDDVLTSEAAAYKASLPEIQNRFAGALAALTVDLIVECPSCAPHAKQFADAASRVHSKASRAAFDYDCVNGKRKKAATGASVSELETTITPRKPFPPLDQITSALIVDDIFNDGDTAACVLNKLRAGKLNPRASILIAVPLRVMASTTKTKYDFSAVFRAKAQ